MPYRVTLADPEWTATNFEAALEKGVATFAKANGVATQSAWDTFINGLTAAQTTAVVKKILATITCSVP